MITIENIGIQFDSNVFNVASTIIAENIIEDDKNCIIQFCLNKLKIERLSPKLSKELTLILVDNFGVLKARYVNGSAFINFKYDKLSKRVILDDPSSHNYPDYSYIASILKKNHFTIASTCEIIKELFIISDEDLKRLMGDYDDKEIH